MDNVHSLNDNKNRIVYYNLGHRLVNHIKYLLHKRFKIWNKMQTNRKKRTNNKIHSIPTVTLCYLTYCVFLTILKSGYCLSARHFPIYKFVIVNKIICYVENIVWVFFEVVRLVCVFLIFNQLLVHIRNVNVKFMKFQGKKWKKFERKHHIL